MEEYEKFFNKNIYTLQVLVDCNEAEFGLEEIYQAFKQRLMKEMEENKQ